MPRSVSQVRGQAPCDGTYTPARKGTMALSHTFGWRADGDAAGSRPPG